MRQETQEKIDALHRQIARLVEQEKSHHDAQTPSANPVLRAIAHNRIELAARSPSDRDQMRWAVASFPTSCARPTR